jgi:hypothetical protein
VIWIFQINNLTFLLDAKGVGYLFSSSSSCPACHISAQGWQRPVAGRIALYAGYFLQPSTKTLNNSTCFSKSSVFIVKPQQLFNLLGISESQWALGVAKFNEQYRSKAGGKELERPNLKAFYALMRFIASPDRSNGAWAGALR